MELNGDAADTQAATGWPQPHPELTCKASTNVNRSFGVDLAAHYIIVRRWCPSCRKPSISFQGVNPG
jgi:hypothetical protein